MTSIDAEYSVLETFLKRECAHGPVYYFRNSGNWGDALIRQGTLKFFRDIGLEYREMSRRKLEWLLPCLVGGTVIYGGGGAWCRFWDNGKRNVQKLRRRFRVIVLPSTYDHSVQMRNVSYFCRDRYESQQNVAEAIFCHDMAFYIGRVLSPRGAGTGFFFRKDRESAIKGQLPIGNRDITAEGTHLSETEPLFEALSQYETIHTDRLHVAIASCLLDREVHLYAGGYFKNRAVFLSSIQPNFERAWFHESPPAFAPFGK
jgi:hypothetical protein